MSKIVDIKSARNSQNNRSSNKRCSLKKSHDGQPTPLDFEAFIPWFCLQLQISTNVIVKKTNQVEYPGYGSKFSKESTKSSKTKSKSTKTSSRIVKSSTADEKTAKLHLASATEASEVLDAIPVTTYYDKQGHLVEISIVGCPVPLNRKVIQAFNICLPFHSDLYKLSIRKCGLSFPTFHEIGNLLPHSNITEICLDDSSVPNGNYSLLLEKPSRIKYLSLKRCGIDDEECKNIAEKINYNSPAAKTMLLLDLGSNKIMDKGAQALGEALKGNRCLLYLNLSGNYISDDGATFLLKYLKEFLLNNEDMSEKWNRRIDYLRTRMKIYENCLKEATLSRLINESHKETHKVQRQNSPTKLASKKINSKSPKKHVHKTNDSKKKSTLSFEELTVEQIAERKTNEIIGPFEHPFKEESIKREGGNIYAIGNLTLCSLNLAYNNLSGNSVRKILDVLKYQSRITKTSHCTGLLKIRIDGNNIMYAYKDLQEIDGYLRRELSITEKNHNIFFKKNYY